MKFVNPLQHPICFSIPERLTSVSAWQEHIPFAMLLIELLRPATLVELGTHAGDSYCAFCQAVKELKFQTRCYAVDTWKGDAHSGYYDESVLADLQAHHDPRYGSFSTLVQSTFDEARGHFADGSIDLLHIDGYHTYKAVKHDFESWLPKLSNKAVVLFHDINVHERGFGISAFWSELKQRFPHFEFLHGHGLGVLGVGEKVPSALRGLFASTENETLAIHDFFFRLGHTFSLQRLVEKSDLLAKETVAKSSETELQVEQLEAAIEELTSRAESLAAELHQRPAVEENTLQMFWSGENGFSEDSSFEKPIARTDRSQHFAFQLPASARGPIRLDPVSRPCFVEIKHIELHSGNPQTEVSAKLLRRWGAENQFAGLEPSTGVFRIEGGNNFSIICIDNDPQLLLKNIPEPDHLTPWFIRITLAISENVEERATDELRRLRTQLEANQTHFHEQAVADREHLASVLEEQELSSQKELLAQQVHFKEVIADLQDKLSETITTSQAQFADRLAMQEQISRAALAEQQSQIRDKQHELKQQIELNAALLNELGSTQHQIALLQAQAETAEQQLAEAGRALELKQQAQDEAKAEAEATVTSLKEALRTRERSLIQQLNHQVEKQQELQRTHGELAGKIRQYESQIWGMTNTRAWRTLSRYRRLKGRFANLVQPANGSAAPSSQNGAGGPRPSSVEPALLPIHELKQVDGNQSWESTGSDPQFEVSRPWPGDWVKISLHIETENGTDGKARLYIDRGEGYAESESCDLGDVNQERVAYLRLGPTARQLRLDPLDCPGRFEIKKFVLQSVSEGKARANEIKSVGEFIRFAKSRADHFSKEHGRLPGVTDLAPAVKRTVSAWRHTPRSALFPAPVEPPPTSPVVEIPNILDPYDAWLEVNEWNARRESLLRNRLADAKDLPLLSVVMPVFNPPLELLDRAIQSVVEQVYDNWELCIADDASTDAQVAAKLRDWAARDSRIRITFREQNGHISLATNSAAETAVGEFIVLLDQDDEITPDALAEVALYVAANPQTDVLYSDDDKIDLAGKRFAPQFKPDWSPELLLSYMYFSHLFVLRRELFGKVGGMRVGFEGSADYDLALRITEKARAVGHIPKVLYHWRALPGSTAASGAEKPESFNAGKKAVQEKLDRMNMSAKVVQPDWALAAHCGIFSPVFPDDGPRVAIIIPTRNQLAVLKVCLDSLARTTYKNYEVVIVDNESDDQETLDYLAGTKHRVLRIPNPAGKFNYAAINNRAAEQVDADYLLFLNNDTEVVAPEWLSQMVGYLGREGVGAVGARLLFPDTRVQHAGIVHGYYDGMVGPAFKLLPAWDHGYMSHAMVARNYAAVTAACMLTPKDLFLKFDGFNEKDFSVAYNDVDYCYRLHLAGHRMVYCPTAELIHHEGFSRGVTDDPAEPAEFRRRYGRFRDPFYNPNLSLEHERFDLDARTTAPDNLPPIRTLMCAFNLGTEGAPYSQFELTVNLHQLGIIDPVVYCPTDGPLRKNYEDAGIKVEVFPHPLTGIHTAKGYEKAVKHFAETIAKWGVELVYGNTQQTFYAIDAARHLGLPSIWNPREGEPWQTYFDFLGSEISPLALRCFSYPYKVIFVSNATRDNAQALNSHHNFVTVHNGIDKKRFNESLKACLEKKRFNESLQAWPRELSRTNLKVEPDEITLLLLGTVCDRKGQIDLVQAIGELSPEEVQRLRVFIVGDREGEYSKRLHELHEALPATHRSRITIVAETDEVAPYFVAADVFICTSRIESYPRVILEAMLAGLAIITTPVFGITEQVQANVNALFYQPGEAADLAAAINRLVKDGDLRRRFAENSPRLLDTLNNYESMTETYGRIFREAWVSGRSRVCAE